MAEHVLMLSRSTATSSMMASQLFLIFSLFFGCILAGTKWRPTNRYRAGGRYYTGGSHLVLMSSFLVVN